MASVTSTQLVSDRAEPDGSRWVRYRFDLLDNLGDNAVMYHGPKSVPSDWDTDADMLALAPRMLEAQAEKEFGELISAIEQGQDPMHFDNGGFWEKETLRWDTWDNYFQRLSEWFWGFDNLIETYPFNLTWGRVNGTDKRNILGVSNPYVTQLNADMQIAIDTHATLSQHQRRYNDGVWQ